MADPTALATVGGCSDPSAECAEALVASLGERALRRAVTAAESERLLGFFAEDYSSAGFATGAEQLVSPLATHLSLKVDRFLDELVDGGCRQRTLSLRHPPPRGGEVLVEPRHVADVDAVRLAVVGCDRERLDVDLEPAALGLDLRDLLGPVLPERQVIAGQFIPVADTEESLAVVPEVAVRRRALHVPTTERIDHATEALPATLA